MAGWSMEEQLKLLSHNTTALRYRYIHDHVQLTLDTLDTQKISYAFKAWQIREKCLSVLKQALESNNPSLCGIALHGIEYIVFHPDLDGIAGDEELDSIDARIFVLQVLDSLGCLPCLSPDQQVHGLKILLGLCCDFISSFDGELIVKIVQLCLACWHKDKINVHSALLQVCAAYTLHTQKLCAASCSRDSADSGVRCAAESLASQAVEKLANADINGDLTKEKLADVTGLAKFFTQQIDRSSSDVQRILHLECLLTVFKTLKSIHVRSNSMFCGYVRRDLCPTVAELLNQNAKLTVSNTRENLTSKAKRKQQKNKKVTSTKNSMLCRKVALLSIELLRLVGCVASVRPHVLTVFTYLLSPTICPDFTTVFVIFKQLWSTPSNLFNAAGPFLIQDASGKRKCGKLILLLLEAMISRSRIDAKGSTTAHLNELQSSINGIIALVNTLNEMKMGHGLNEEQVAVYLSSSNNIVLSDDGLSDDGESASGGVELKSPTKSGDYELKRVDSNPIKNETIEAKVPLEDNKYFSEDDEVWASSEDIYSSVSSPCYQSAAEDQDDFNKENEGDHSSKLSGLMQYLSNVARSSFLNKQNDDGLSSCSTYTASNADNEDDDSDGNIEKYLGNGDVSPRSSTTPGKMVNSAEEERNRLLAQRHVQAIADILPDLLQYEDVSTVDQALQKAASALCADIYETWHMEKIPVQADSLYILSYSMLLLCLRLKLSGHYEAAGVQLPCMENQWITYQQSRGVYLSKSWLSETFHQVIITDLLGNAGFDNSADLDTPHFITVLAEIDGLGCNDLQLLHDTKPPVHANEKKSITLANIKFAKEISMMVWSKAIQMLQHHLQNIHVSPSDVFVPSHPLASPDFLRIENQKQLSCILSGLEGLTSAFKLSCGLGLHSFTGSLLSQIVEACIPGDYTQACFSVQKTRDSEEKELRLHASHVLCMDAVFNAALDVGSHSSSAWTAFFRLVSYVAYLDRLCFDDVKRPSMNNGGVASTSSQDLGTLLKESMNISSSKHFPSERVEFASLEYFTREQTVKAVRILSAKLDHLFEQAAISLNLQTLTHFVWRLCISSNYQLFPPKPTTENQYGIPLLCRLGKCVMTCVQSSNRPLLHVATVWNYISPHFAKAIGHRNVEIAKLAIAFLRDITNWILACSSGVHDQYPLSHWSVSEPAYFHFNEALLRPFERALQTESCTAEVQDIILLSIYKLVEKNSKQICSGWRPLFSSLRHLNGENERWMECSVFDVLNAFFAASKCHSVFSNAAYDCVKCLLKILTNFEDYSGDVTLRINPILRYFEECASLLMELLENESEVKFINFHRIDVTPSCSGDGLLWKDLTTPRWMTKENRLITEVIEELSDMTEKCFGDDRAPCGQQSHTKCRVSFVDPTGALHIMFLLMDGLTTSVLTSPQNGQTFVLDFLCKLLENCYKVPGPSFCCHILLHSCLPTLFTWVDRLILFDNNSIFATEDLVTMVTSFKHMYGTIMEFTANIILRELRTIAKRVATKEKSEALTNMQEQIELLWRAYLNVCISCIKSRKESLAKLGCSCLRHIITTVGGEITSTMIADVCRCVSCAVDDCLSLLSSLITLQKRNTEAVSELKIEIKEHDTAFCDSSCLTKTFQAVNASSLKDLKNQDIYVISSSSFTGQVSLRISLCEVACDIASLQLLLKCIEHMLLDEEQLLWQHPNHDNSRNSAYHQGGNDEHAANEASSLHSNVEQELGSDLQYPNSDTPTVGMIDFLTSSQLHTLCACIAKTFVTVQNFNMQYDLQRLISKLERFYHAANLYQFAAISVELYIKITMAVCTRTSNEVGLSNTEPFPDTWKSFTNKTYFELQDLHPSFKEPNEDDLKPDVNHTRAHDWSFKGLHNCLNFLCQIWNMDSSLMPSRSIYDLQKNNNGGGSSANSVQDSNPMPSLEETAEANGSEDAEMMYDYMTYVNKTKAPERDFEFSANENNQAEISQRRLYKEVGDKTIGRLIRAYKLHRKSKLNPDEVISREWRDDVMSHKSDSNTLSSSKRRSRTSSEGSFVHSVLVVDDATLQREVWVQVIESILGILTSASDPALSKLLPAIYRPLASLSNASPQFPASGDCYVGEAFHKWLLRVGEFYHLLMLNRAEIQ